MNSYKGYTEGMYAARKGRLCQIKKIHFEMHPPSVTVYMMDTENEVGTEFNKLNHIKSWFCNMCTAENKDINATKCCFCNGSRDYKEKIVIQSDEEFEKENDAKKQELESNELPSTSTSTNMEKPEDSEKEIPQNHQVIENNMDDMEVSQDDESPDDESQEPPKQNIPLNTHKDDDDELDDHDMARGQEIGHKQHIKQDINDNDDEYGYGQDYDHDEPVKQRQNDDESNFFNPMLNPYGRYNKFRNYNQSQRRRGGGSRRRNRRYDPWGFGLFPDDDFMNFGF